MNIQQPRYHDIFAGHDDGGAMAERATALWAEYRADLMARKLWTRPHARTLDRLIRATVEYQQLHPQAVAIGPVSTAEGGGQYFSYIWAAVRQLSDQIAKLERALMLTPESVGAKWAGGLKPDEKAAADEFISEHRLTAVVV